MFSMVYEVWGLVSTDEIQAHSLRGAATSAAFTGMASLSEICCMAAWSSPYYKLDSFTSVDAACGSKVLQRSWKYKFFCFLFLFSHSKLGIQLKEIPLFRNAPVLPWLVLFLVEIGSALPISLFFGFGTFGWYWSFPLYTLLIQGFTGSFFSFAYLTLTCFLVLRVCYFLSSIS